MNFADRAIRYVWRKKTKTIILFCILLAAETMLFSNLLLLRAAQEAKASLQEKTKTKFIVNILDEKKPILADEEDAISNLENVNSVNRKTDAEVWPDGFGIITESGDTSEENQVLKFCGYDDLESDGPFAEAQVKLTKGSYPEQNNQILVNKSLANANGWNVGSAVALKTGQGKEMQAEISGLYTSGMESKQVDTTLAVYRIENTIYGSVEFANEINGNESFTGLMVYLKDPEKLDATDKEITEIVGDKAEITKSDTLFLQMKQPLEQAVRIVKLVLILTAGTTLVIVPLIMSMWMRARKKELAVYISLGETKGLVFIQTVLENILIFGTATSAAVLTGSLVTGFLKNVLSAAGLGTDLKAEITSESIFQLVPFVAMVLLAADLLALYPVLKANPKDTLSEMEG